MKNQRSKDITHQDGAVHTQRQDGYREILPFTTGCVAKCKEQCVTVFAKLWLINGGERIVVVSSLWLKKIKVGTEWRMPYLWRVFFLITLCGLCNAPAVVSEEECSSATPVTHLLSDDTLRSLQCTCCCQWRRMGSSATPMMHLLSNDTLQSLQHTCCCQWMGSRASSIPRKSVFTIQAVKTTTRLQFLGI